MYTSDTESFRDYGETALTYLVISLLCALFGWVYEQFSHEVYSNYMLYAFGFPLAGGALPYLLACLYPHRCRPGGLERSVHHCGIATLTVGSILCGVLEIYGTTNRLTQVYWVAGWGMLALAAGCYVLRCWRNRK